MNTKTPAAEPTALRFGDTLCSFSLSDHPTLRCLATTTRVSTSDISSWFDGGIAYHYWCETHAPADAELKEAR